MRQTQGYILRVCVIDKRYRPRRIDERDIADIQSYGLIILQDCRTPEDLKYCVVKLYIIEARIPLRPLDAVSIQRGRLPVHNPSHDISMLRLVYWRASSRSAVTTNP
jgi:hypothetical protein